MNPNSLLIHSESSTTHQNKDDILNRSILTIYEKEVLIVKEVFLFFFLLSKLIVREVNK